MSAIPIPRDVRANVSLEASPWLTPKQVAEQLQVTHRTVLDWIASGELRARKFGRVWRISAAAYKAFVESRPENQADD